MTIKRNALGHPLKGESLNPNGRPKGSKNKLAQSFFTDCLKVWEESGFEALRDMAQTDPASFNRMIASTMPKDVDLDVTSSDASMTPPATINIIAQQPDVLDDDESGPE